MRLRYGARGAMALAMTAGALVLLPLPTASAATITLAGGSLTITGDAIGETVVTTFDEDTDTVTFSGISGALPAGCAGAGTVTCTGVSGTYTLNTAGGADVVTATGDVTIDLGPGNDRVTFTDNPDAYISGGADNDTLVAQGSVSSFGSQTEGGPGNDVLRGGPGIDSFDDEPGADTYVGGGPAPVADVSVTPLFMEPALDSISYGGAAPLSITLDGVANDGPAGEGDNIANDIALIGGGDANDLIDISGAAFGGMVLAGSGDDVVIGSSHGDMLTDGRGADDVRGGPGNDRIGSGGSFFSEFYPDSDYLSAPSADRYDGGPGDDRLGLGFIQIADGALEGVGSYGADVFLGGPGHDTVVADARTCLTEPYSCNPHTAHAINISLDDVANDGAVGVNLGINVRSDIESIEAGAGNDTLLGSAAANTISGGAGNDSINPLGGADAVLGGAGADAITSRDGVADAVDCGIGADAGVVGDTTDALIGCEGVNNLAFAPGIADSPPVITGKAKVKLTAKKLQKAKALKLTVSVDDVSMLLASATSTKLVGGSTVLLGEAALRAGSGRRTVSIKLSKALTKKLVNRAKRTRKGVPVKVKVVAVNQSGRTTTKVFTITVVK